MHPNKQTLRGADMHLATMEIDRRIHKYLNVVLSWTPSIEVSGTQKQSLSTQSIMDCQFLHQKFGNKSR